MYSVDKREAIRLFIKRNSSLFRTDPFPSEVFKKLKQEFFLKFAKISVPKDSEIAGEIIEGMINSNQLKNEADLEKILDLPFFSNRISNKEYYREKMSLLSKESTRLLDVNKLKEAEYVQKIKEELKNEVRQEIIQEKEEKIARLEQKIAEKTEEFLAIPSILDQKEIEIPEVNEPEDIPETETAYKPWWEKLGLKEDPFHLLEGLDQIDRNLYDQIVYKTEIFRKYISIIQNSPADLFRNIVVFGDWGSGKTTFFDYIEPLLYDRMLYPIYIQLGGEFEVRELVFEFSRQLVSELSHLHMVLTGRSPVALASLEDEGAIVKILTKLGDKSLDRHARGFIIFIDDLHKGDLEKAVGFMSHLQILGSKMRRDSNIKIGFFVAGSLEWERRMANDERFSGSVHTQERVPPLKPEIALEAINRRLKVFSKNPSNPRQLDISFINKIYKGLQYSGQEITFRRLMREVINEFEGGHFDALSANPVKIPLKVLDAIQSILENSPALKRQLNKLLYGAKSLTPPQKRRCLELLVSIYVQNGLLESEIREQEVPFLQQLARAGLIRKTEDGKLVWKISGELLSINNSIINQYNLSLEDYLLRIFLADKQAERKKFKEKNEEIQKIDSMISRMKPDVVREHLESARVLHDEILQSGYKYLDNDQEAVSLIHKCTKSLGYLTMAYQAYERLRMPMNEEDTRVLIFWKSFWWSPEVMQQFVRAVSSETEDRKRLVPHVMSIYREAFPVILGFISDEIDKSTILHIPVTGLKNDEIGLLHECRDLWMENKYDEIAGKLTKTIETKIRDFLFNFFTLLYGEFEERSKYLDPETRKYIIKNIKTETDKGFAVSTNEFKQLNRGQYKNIMTGVHGVPEGRRNWLYIFSRVFRWTEQELDSFLDVFAEFNIKVGHIKEDTMGPQEQDYVYGFIQKSLRFMIDVNNAYLKLLSGDSFRFSSPNNSCFSLSNFKDSGTLTPIELGKTDVERFMEAFEAKTHLRIPLDDSGYLQGVLGLSYRKIFALMALLKGGTENQRKATKLSLDVLETRGCELIVRLSKLTGYFSFSYERGE